MKFVVGDQSKVRFQSNRFRLNLILNLTHNKQSFLYMYISLIVYLFTYVWDGDSGDVNLFIRL